jgi:hypothetical protein
MSKGAAGKGFAPFQIRIFAKPDPKIAERIKRVSWKSRCEPLAIAGVPG